MSEYRPGPASLHTRLVFERARTELPFCDLQDQADALRGRLAPLPAGAERSRSTLTTAPAPGTATHPSLLRIGELRRITGVFEVVPGVHQVRGLEDRNVTLVDSRRGRVIVDAPHSLAVTRAAVALVDEHAGARPVVARLWAGAGTGTAEIDGLVVDSVRVPDDAVSEVLRWFPSSGFLYAAASVQHSLPPLTSTGRVRDPVAWSQALHDVLCAHREELEVVAGARDWPTWGNGRVRQLLTDQRDLLRYVHDEVLRLGYRGHACAEVVSLLQLPPALAVKWHARGYDSTLEAHARLLHPGEAGTSTPDPSPWQPPVSRSAAVRFLSWAGGLPGAVGRLRTAYAEGDYRWVAQAGEMVLVAEPDAPELRRITAQAYEQLSYQAENIGQHHVFAERAQHLALSRGEPRQPHAYCVVDRASDRLIDHLGVRLEGPRAAQHPLQVRWSVTDAGRDYLLEVHNGALFATQDATAPVEATIASSRATLAAIVCDHLGWRTALREGSARVDGDLQVLDLFFGLLDPWPCPLRPRPAPSPPSTPSSPSLQEEP
ncbi:alkyl sulfatase dimerization domain-containing protein [Nocardioides daeguensis]|uniref:SCP2 domain-containing protein n=1 Tax=Nocardioides daeguensis TaxID=908359 RepID=A0ABP6WAP9_9ACTN|nr:alkyl sulfatase dimerization domain-containing protein [Nocardioides daeguensis]MBV6729769.1 hypothetical protein [Nocardioides daeguensis]MCR1773575.1 hypothetical protein [Nocardioides daeguensis]